MPVRFRILATRGAASSPGGPLVEREVEVAGAPAEIRIGRSPDVELPLPFATLSGIHARLERAPGGAGWLVEDARSTNGTWLDGARLAPDERRPLAPGAELRLGDVRVRFEGERSGAGAPTAEGTGTIARRLVDDLFAATPSKAPSLHVVSGTVPRRLALDVAGRAYVAGRGEACDLPLVVEEVSREHASFTRAVEGIVVRDLGSKNGVVFGGARVAGTRVLVDGDVVEIGPVSVRVEDPVGRYLRELEAAPVAAPVVPEAPAAAPAPEAPVAPAAPRRRSTQLALLVGVGVLLLLVGVVAAVVFLSPR
jgi:pSer/pThr/pTyr-binding forkhead associated (FHA) protein